MKLENLYGNGFKHFSKWDLFSSKMRMNEEFYISLLAKEGKSFYLKIPDRDEFRNGVVSNLLLRQYNLY